MRITIMIKSLQLNKNFFNFLQKVATTYALQEPFLKNNYYKIAGI